LREGQEKRDSREKDYKQRNKQNGIIRGGIIETRDNKCTVLKEG
jgi:F0F1-type ATP synthase epsilon subunit